MNARGSRMRFLVTAGLAAVLVLGACNDDGNGNGNGDGAVVAVELNEWDVIPNPASVSAGEVTFNAENTGTIPHELVIVRSDEAPDALPVEDGRVPEDEVDVIGEIEEFSAGGSESDSFTLESGSYILLCNIVGHYEAGMHAAFTVQ